MSYSPESKGQLSGTKKTAFRNQGKHPVRNQKSPLPREKRSNHPVLRGTADVSVCQKHKHFGENCLSGQKNDDGKSYKKEEKYDILILC